MTAQTASSDFGELPYGLHNCVVFGGNYAMCGAVGTGEPPCDGECVGGTNIEWIWRCPLI